MAFNVELSIAVTHNFVSRVNLRDVLTFLTRHKEDAVGPTVGVASESGSGAREGFYRKPTVFDLGRQFKEALRRDRKDLAAEVAACEAALELKEPKSTWSTLAGASEEGGGSSFSFNF